MTYNLKVMYNTFIVLCKAFCIYFMMRFFLLRLVTLSFDGIFLEDSTVLWNKQLKLSENYWNWSQFYFYIWKNSLLIKLQVLSIRALDDSAKYDLRNFRSFWPFVILLPGHEFNFSYAADWMDQFLSPRKQLRILVGCKFRVDWT